MLRPFFALLFLAALPAAAQPVTIRPGAPGQPSRVITPEVPPARAPVFTEADVLFMQGMIPHHAQALDMTALARSRTDNPALLALARKIEVAQGDEIRWMQRWLRERGQTVPEVSRLDDDAHAGPTMPSKVDAHAGHTMPQQEAAHQGHGMPQIHHGGDHSLMAGMLTANEMAELAAATGADFDRHFLRYMIRHHEGGLLMVAELLAAPGGGEASEVYHLATDIDADQRADIRRMLLLLGDTPPLPTILR